MVSLQRLSLTLDKMGEANESIISYEDLHSTALGESGLDLDDLFGNVPGNVLSQGLSLKVGQGRGRGTWDAGTRGRGDVRTWGRGDAGTWERGDAGTRGLQNSEKRGDSRT